MLFGPLLPDPSPHDTMLHAFLALVPALPLAAQEPLVLTGATVVDGTEGDPTPGATVVVEDGRITYVGAPDGAPSPDGARVVDAAGRYLIPGLWDLHARPDHPGFWHLEPSEEAREHWLALFVAHGVTSIRDMGGDAARIRRWQERVATGELVGPRILTGGTMIEGENPRWEGSIAATTPEEGRAAVDRLAEQGVDFVNVHTLLAPPVFHAVAERAAERGLPLYGDVPREMSPFEAAEAGLTSQELYLGVVRGVAPREVMKEKIDAVPLVMDDVELRNLRIEAIFDSIQDDQVERLGRVLVEKHVAVVPALVWQRRRAFFEPAAPFVLERGAFLPDYVMPWWMSDDNIDRELLGGDYQTGERRILVEYLDLTRALHEAGVQVLVGTDTGTRPLVFPGFSVHEELALFVQAGLSPQAALRAATSQPAAFLGLADEVGTVAPGRRADLVLLEADPLADIANVGRIAGVVRDGRFLDRAALDALLVPPDAPGAAVDDGGE